MSIADIIPLKASSDRNLISILGTSGSTCCPQKELSSEMTTAACAHHHLICPQPRHTYLGTQVRGHADSPAALHRPSQPQPRYRKQANRGAQPDPGNLVPAHPRGRGARVRRRAPLRRASGWLSDGTGRGPSRDAISSSGTARGYRRVKDWRRPARRRP